MKLYHDIPSSQGVENAIKRAKQMVTAAYTPIKPLPIVYKVRSAQGVFSYIEHDSPAGFPLCGMVYSSVRRTEKYIGYNISPETFFTALKNPNSVLYMRRIDGTGQNVHAYYGIVCSAFVSYVFDLPYRTPCVRLPQLEGMEEIECREPEGLKLLDILLDTGRHVAVVTDIERDETGKVHAVYVSESVMPFCRTTRFTPDEFRMFWMESPYCRYKIYRYAHTDHITYTPSPFLRLEGEEAAPERTYTLLPDFGNQANYVLGQDPVEISIFDPDYPTVLVTDPSGEQTSWLVHEGKVIFNPEKPGFYTACAVNGSAQSEEIAWCVTDLSFTVDRDAYRPGETVRVCFQNSAPDSLVAWQFNNKEDDRGKSGGTCSGVGSKGELVVPVPAFAGQLELYLIAKNQYGCYSSRRIPIKISEE
ncbi:MAG: hypothetical protein J5885_01355 [Clostridia bacterium]|nr:hypothetical protein [Clostridia bacterium]